MVDWNEDAKKLTDNVTVLIGPNNGAYPSGNSLVVQGAGESIIIDPSVTVVDRGGPGVPIDAIVNSHAHEDHMAGNGLFPNARVHIHNDDLLGVTSLDGLMDVYGRSKPCTCLATRKATAVSVSTVASSSCPTST